MIILDKPFVSEFLKQTIIQYQIPVLKLPVLNELNINGDIKYISENEAIELLKTKPNEKIYTNSENAIHWISKNLYFTDIPAKINLFKDKVLFRELIKPIYPDFYFKSISINEFDDIDIQSIPKPFIIKPAIGFFSMAVYKVNSNSEWGVVKSEIKNELKRVEGIYPTEVMDTHKFIIEQVIEGDEYAIDAYFNEKGELVILNIMNHVFSSGNDFSDRLYITSSNIIKDKKTDFEKFLVKIGQLADLKNFPLHVEIRVDSFGNIVPIEVNPLRFGAWCTTADATWYAYQLNSIATYFADKKPDWENLLAKKDKKTFSMMVLENSTGYKVEQIKSFNYDRLLADFEKPLDIRKIDFHKYPVFGFLFAETLDENYSELDKILKSNLTEYIDLKD